MNNSGDDDEQDNESGPLSTNQDHRPTKPRGAVTVEEASRLNEPINDNKKHSGCSALNAPQPPKELGQFEDEVFAKQRGHLLTGEDAAPSMPGAFAKKSNSVAPLKLSALERDVAAKRQVTGKSKNVSSSRPGAFAVLSSTAEEIVASKVLRGQIRTELASLEDSVAAKIHEESHRSSRPHAVLDSRKKDLAKVRTETSPSLDGRSMADSIMVKTSGQRSSASAEDRDAPPQDSPVCVDERIAAKTAGIEERTLAMTIPNTAATAIETMPAAETWSPAPAAEEDTPKDEKHAHEKDEEAGRVPDTEATTTAVHGIYPETDLEYGAVDGTELAVAIEVEEDDDDAYIPSAVEYDLDSKPPIYRNRRFRLYAFAAFAVIVVAAVGMAVGFTVGRKNQGSSTPAPTAAPTSIRESLGIKAQIEQVVGSELLEEPETPYAKALEWITFDDPLQLSPEAPNFIQRYFVAYFYFATTTDGPWLSCNPPKDPWNGNSSCTFLKLVSVYPLGYQDVPWTRWLSNNTECEWAGIMCDRNDQIRVLSLSGGALSGEFPEGIYNLPFLQTITLDWNNFRGSLPPKLADMKHLLDIQLHFNNFTGSIPSEWWRARNLQRMNLGMNMITGTIPPEIGNLRDLKSLFLFNNMLHGVIPEEIGTLDSLAYLRLSGNNFEGSIPNAVASMKNIQEVWLMKNQITGTIPTVIGELKSATDLRFHVNPMWGEIPDEIYTIPGLARLDLYECSFTGTISPKIGSYKDKLRDLRISDNKFSGTLPSEMASLTALTSLWVNGNDFTGTVPDALCDLKGGAILEEFVADCKDNEAGVAELTCPQGCCSACCKADGTDCL